MHYPTSAYRHAAYFAPAPESPGWLLGAQWLGRCPRSAQALTQPLVDGWTPATFAQLTQEPRRYGWHGTLKAPFSLAADCNVQSLNSRFAEVAAGLAGPFTVAVELAKVGNFLALVPKQPCPQLQALAEVCVRHLHPCAAPLPATEIARRSRGGLSARQMQMLEQWGYPYVMQDFAFHMTLTGILDGLSPDQIAQVLQHAKDWFAPVLADGLQIDALSWFAEETPGADFQWVRRFEFAS
ncbi:MAG: DUF1045 domain-containing protein [Rhodoferax sp.]|nr:DUF1045 domain-containing protein [Rhodoferax sp.]